MTSLIAVATASWSLVVWSLGFSILSILILRQVLALRITVPLVLVKFLLPFTYFAIWADGSWFIGGDDSAYLQAGIVLLDTGMDPFSILINSEARQLFSSPSLAVYQWWNMAWMYFIERAYYAPVLANVFVSVLSGYIFYNILQVIGFPKIYREGFLVFFLLHWDTVAWTSFLNLKEPLVIFAMLLLIRSALNLERKEKLWIGIIGVLGCTMFFQGIRFYFPVLIGIAYVIYFIWRSRKITVALTVLFLAALAAWILLADFIPLIRQLVSPAEVGSGIARVLLSPIPWRITDPATYLTPGSVLHWILLPCAVFSGWQFIRRPDETRFLVLVLVIGLTFYALVPRIGSPRHRAPLMALWCLLEYHFVYLVLTSWLRARFESNRREFQT